MTRPWFEEVQEAANLASVAHRNQYDRRGHPFIGHPLRVAAYVADFGRLDLVPAAWLHDVIEDTPFTLGELVMLGFNDDTVQAVDAMTRRDGEIYDQYVERVRDAGVAKLKLADLKDNLDPNRRGDFVPVDRYMRAWDRLGGIRADLWVSYG